MSLSKYQCWEPPAKNLRGREISLINTIYNAHDILCSCSDPPVHILALLFYPMGPFDNDNLQKAVDKLKKKPLTQKCLTFGTAAGEGATTGSGDDADGPDLIDGLDTVGLEELFAEDNDGNLTDAAG